MLSALRRLWSDTRAVAMTEFALSAPFVLVAGLYGLETANMAVVKMRMSQAAMQAADNASRIGDTSTLQNRKIYESDLNDLLYGAHLHAGASLELYEHGRVIVSSLEVVPGTDDQQWIHWQRCAGKLSWTSSYGLEGDGYGSGIAGMGPAGEEVRAPKGGAVVFVEVAYEYQPLITDVFMSSKTMHAYSAFMVRDDRDLSGIMQRDPGSPDPVAGCSQFEGIGPIAG